MTIEEFWVIMDSRTFDCLVTLAVVVGGYLLMQWYIAGKKGAK